MSEAEREAVLQRIRVQAASEQIRVTQHAHEEMVEEEISLDEVLQAIHTSQMLEYYFEHRRGPCCLLDGTTNAGRAVHVVCTTAQRVLVLITVYEPRPPNWLPPGQRRKR